MPRNERISSQAQGYEKNKKKTCSLRVKLSLCRNLGELTMRAALSSDVAKLSR